MKTFLILFCFVAVNAGAQLCSSVWIYQPWKSCRAETNGVDKSAGEVVIPERIETTKGPIDGWMKGGSDPTAECNKLAARYDSDSGEFGTRGTGVPNGEESTKPLGVALYKYHCKITVSKYPFLEGAAPSCGVEDTWQTEEVGKPLADLKGQAICLSCDNVKDAKGRLDCLKTNIDQVISQKKVTLKQPELDAVQKSLQGLIDVQQTFKNTFDVDQQQTLIRLQSQLKQAADELH